MEYTDEAKGLYSEIATAFHMLNEEREDLWRGWVYQVTDAGVHPYEHIITFDSYFEAVGKSPSSGSIIAAIPEDSVIVYEAPNGDKIQMSAREAAKDTLNVKFFKENVSFLDHIAGVEKLYKKWVRSLPLPTSLDRQYLKKVPGILTSKYGDWSVDVSFALYLEKNGCEFAASHRNANDHEVVFTLPILSIDDETLDVWKSDIGVMEEKNTPGVYKSSFASRILGLNVPFVEFKGCGEPEPTKAKKTKIKRSSS